MSILTKLSTPIIAAPMAGGPSTVALATALHHAGGLGFLAAGYKTPEALGKELDSVGDDVPVGVNLFVPPEGNPNPDGDEALETYIRSLTPVYERFSLTPPEPASYLNGDVTDYWDDKLELLTAHARRRSAPTIASFTFGAPSAPEVSALHDAGLEVWVTVTNPADAIEAINRGADGLVVQGPLAGGHQSTWDVADEPNALSLNELCAMIHDKLSNIPLVAAGGIATSDDVANALALPGVIAVSCGTAFLPAEESGATATHRRALLSDSSSDTKLTRVFSGRPARGIINEWIERFDQISVRAYPHVNTAVGSIRKAAAQGDDPDYMALWAGANYRHCTPGTAHEIIDRLMAKNH